MTSVERRTGGTSGSGCSGRAKARAARVGGGAGVGLGLLLALAATFGLACAASDSGGMSGTGVSQGSISSFGSIFVNGVEWELGGATIELDGVRRSEADLRVGMIVRVDGDLAENGLSGQASRVAFDDSIEGPIANLTAELVPGLRTFEVLGTTVLVRTGRTVFDDVTFATLGNDMVVEVSGLVDPTGAIEATRIERKGTFPVDDDVELRGQVANLVKNPDGSGIFDLGSIVVRYTSATRFSDVSRAELATNDLVEIEGIVRPSGDEVDADRLELESEGFGEGDLDDASIEGFVTDCAASLDYCVAGIPIDDSNATFEPPGFVPTEGDRVEVDGRLVAGVLVAERCESEDADDEDRDVRIDAAISSINSVARTLVVLGVTISADGNTVLDDESSLEDESLAFSELQVGQWIEVEAVATGATTARALRIERDDADPGDDDVRLEGPVTALDPNAPSLSILGQSIPLGPGTEYRDLLDQQRTEEQFFRIPGDVALGDVVRATDQDAASLSVLAEADEVELEEAN